MSDSSFNRRRLLGIFALITASVILLGAGLAIWLHRRSDPSPSFPSSLSEVDYPLPPFSESPFLNTKANASFVGIEVCKECHSSNYRSYLLTPHSRALSDLHPDAEPPDGSFEHKLSGRSYRVYRRGKEFRHEEVARDTEGKEITRIDLPIRYLVGSGNFTRSYLVEVDGFLHESPITWYSTRKSWGLSPGYDLSLFGSFERPAKAECLACHTGRAEATEGAVHRANFHEQPIGCENCHGPGSVHVAAHRAGELSSGKEDWTIVNPTRIYDRARLEAICSYCHLSGVARANVRGRRINDFRPGMPLTDYRVDYRFDSDDEKMKVVGHVEQLRASACYQKSTMTCLTCHDPHATQKPTNVAAYYRTKCLSCHAEQSCALKPVERQKKDPADNCTSCHMPRGATDIPHIAFTHHRIGRHPLPPAIESDAPPKLVPIEDDSRLPEIDRQRNLGLAYVEASFTSQAKKRSLTRVYLGRARDILNGARQAGLHDGATLQALANIYWELEDYDRAEAFAREAVEAKDLSADERANVLRILADGHVREHHYDAAIDTLKKLTRLRRYPEDWKLLGICYLQQGQPREAVQSLEQAIAIRPFHHELYELLADAYLRLRDTEHWQQCQEKARRLAQRERR